MDKETLSHYGWIVILVLILAVLLALASPFGNFVAGAIKATTAGFFSVNKNALDIAGIVMPDQEFDEPDINPTPVVQPEPTPEMSEHGFYYNQIYVGRLMGSYKARAHNILQHIMMIPGEDGTPYAVYFTYSDEGMIPEYYAKMTIDDTGLWTDEFGSTYRVFANGTELEMFEGFLTYGGILTFDDEYSTTMSKYEEVYTNAETGEKYVLHENNTITITDTNGVETTYNTKWMGKAILKVEGYGHNISIGLKTAKALYISAFSWD